MDKKIFIQNLSDMDKAIKIMRQNLNNEEVLKFYIGELSVLNRANMAMLIKAK